MELLKNYISTTERSLCVLITNLSEWKNAQKVAQYGGHDPRNKLKEIAEE